jgi:hypothetical protein
MTTSEPIRASEVSLESPPERPGTWTTRIVGHGTENPEELLANPRNWRIHPRRQQDALKEALDKVGWVQSVIVNKTTGHVVDGHLRVGMAITEGEPEIPVAYVELTEEEERIVLASLDPLASLAVTDEAALKGLMGDLEGSLDHELARMLADLAKDTGTASDATPTQEEIDARGEELDSRWQGLERGNMLDVTCPACAHEFAINKDEFK